jgi:UDP-glucose 6-dehydrogenase
MVFFSVARQQTGLAFTAETDDVQKSASLRIIRQLAELKCEVIAHDAIAGEHARTELSNVRLSLIDDSKKKRPRWMLWLLLLSGQSMRL